VYVDIIGNLFYYGRKYESLYALRCSRMSVIGDKTIFCEVNGRTRIYSSIKESKYSISSIYRITI
jgi:hypothetical protein